MYHINYMTTDDAVYSETADHPYFPTQVGIKDPTNGTPKPGQSEKPMPIRTINPFGMAIGNDGNAITGATANLELRQSLERLARIGYTAYMEVAQHWDPNDTRPTWDEASDTVKEATIAEAYAIATAVLDDFFAADEETDGSRSYQGLFE